MTDATTSVNDVDADKLYRALRHDRQADAVSVILKLRGETCDIDCLYCFEKRKLAPGGRRLAAADAGRIADLFGQRPVRVELHGGEPLTAGREHLAGVLDALSAQPNVVGVSLQTNGIQLDSDWLDLFEAHYPDLQIGISLDGDSYGNSWRVGYDGDPTYPRVVNALHLLAERGKSAGVITVVTSRLLGRAAEVLDHLASFEAINAISFVPCFDTHITEPTASPGQNVPVSRRLQRTAVTDQGPSWATSHGEYAEFTLAATAQWVSSGAFRRIALEPAVSVIRRIRGLHTTNCHFTGLKCDHVFTLYPDQRLGSCDELPWPAAQLTTLDRADDTTDVTSAQQRSRPLRAGKALMAKCATCSYAASCGGGCVATRVRQQAAAGDDDAYCDHRKRLIDGIAALLAAPQHTQGMFCRRIHWRPRSPNRMPDVVNFLARWDNPLAERPPARLRHSGHGNINATGGLHGADADDLDPHHAQWRDAIEDTVWPLVDVLTSDWDCVTYDSCQGHHYDSHSATTLRVGILPRNPTDAAQVASRLCRTLAISEQRLPTACSATIGRAELTCVGTGSQYPVLDLHIVPAANGTWAEYFAALPAAVDELTTAMATTPPATDCGCSQPIESSTANGRRSR